MNLYQEDGEHGRGAITILILFLFIPGRQGSREGLRLQYSLGFLLFQEGRGTGKSCYYSTHWVFYYFRNVEEQRKAAITVLIVFPIIPGRQRNREGLLLQYSFGFLLFQEGRGTGKGCYYWDTEEKMTVAERDPVLDKVIRYIDPTVPVNVTFKKQFTTSINKVCHVNLILVDGVVCI